MTWKMTLSFVISATLLTLTVGWLIATGAVPIQKTIQFSDAERAFMQVWMRLAIAIGLILPSVAWLIGFKHPQLRKILGFYLSVLIVQIITEQIFSSVVFPSLVVVIGTIYTTFRLWQLWQGQQLMDTFHSSSRKWVDALLSILGLFWSSNLIMLLTLGWSSVLN
jgi:vacuolar-type H+-ATPase subunit I/STV1